MNSKNKTTPRIRFRVKNPHTGKYFKMGTHKTWTNNPLMAFGTKEQNEIYKIIKKYFPETWRNFVIQKVQTEEIIVDEIELSNGLNPRSENELSQGLPCGPTV